MTTITLKNRIIVTLAIFTILIIGIFITIQLRHELGMVRKYNESEATLVYLTLGDVWKKISALPQPLDEKIKLLEKKLNSLKESKTIVKAYILNKKREIISSTESILKGGKGDYDDLETIDKINKAIAIKTEAIVDKDQQLFSFYLPLEEQIEDRTEVVYLARIFFSLGNLPSALRQVYGPAITLGILIIIANIFLGAFLSRLIIGPIRVFNEAAKTIASGRLDSRVNIHTGDELEEVADTFNFMAVELVKMKERAENANPLTKLPGNIVIMEEVERRIKQGVKFTVIYCDLDNFKAFNDKYGIHKGDEAIKLTGDTFKEAVKLKGNQDDFIGHEGGDDFILLTTPERADDLANCIISEFDKKVSSLYDKEDLERGYIIAHARDGSVKQFPIMTISLAGVSNEKQDIKNYGEVTNIAAEVKKRAKKEAKSCYVLNQRIEDCKA